MKEVALLFVLASILFMKTTTITINLSFIEYLPTFTIIYNIPFATIYLKFRKYLLYHHLHLDATMCHQRHEAIVVVSRDYRHGATN